jgi:hypothetical protein
MIAVAVSAVPTVYPLPPTTVSTTVSFGSDMLSCQTGRLT